MEGRDGFPARRLRTLGLPPPVGALPKVFALHLFDQVLFAVPRDVAGSGKSRGSMSTTLMCASAA